MGGKGLSPALLYTRPHDVSGTDNPMFNPEIQGREPKAIQQTGNGADFPMLAFDEFIKCQKFKLKINLFS